MVRTPRFVWFTGVALITACAIAGAMIVLLVQKNERVVADARASQSKSMDLQRKLDEQSTQLKEAKNNLADAQSKLTETQNKLVDFEKDNRKAKEKLSAEQAAMPARAVGNVVAAWSADRTRVDWRVMVHNPASSAAVIKPQYFCFDENDLQHAFDGPDESLPPFGMQLVQGAALRRGDCPRNIMVIVLWQVRADSRTPLATYVW